MQSRDILCLTLPGSGGIAPAIAASRAGAVGLLDWRWRRGSIAAPESISGEIAQLARKGRGRWGLRLPAHASAEALAICNVLATVPDIVVLCGDGVESAVAAWRELGDRVSVLVEATSVLAAEAAIATRCDGLVLKGHEAAGYVGAETSFVLVQHWLKRRDQLAESDARYTETPFWVHGGVGPQTAAACWVAGARGVVLDAQLLLCRESQLGETERRLLAALDGGETRLVGRQFVPLRICNRTAPKFTEQLEQLAKQEGLDAAAWQSGVDELFANCDDANLAMIGPDVVHAAPLAEQLDTVAGVLQAIEESVRRSVSEAKAASTLRPDSPFAADHLLEFPIVQGPMTRVSDTSQFAASVADGGALPFLALAMLRGAECRKLMEETAERLGDRSWGVGLLGFLPPELREEQLEVVKALRPPYAIIAGGRPDQASELEKLGIRSYLHVPSPGLLEMFLKDGAKRFIFEGRECGGHVGPRTSFVLWETAIRQILNHIGPSAPADQYHVVFAGGIHDAVSAAMVATMAAPLARRGVRVGLLMGTAYLFTEEAVAGGAIVPRFQSAAVQTSDTVLLETGPGHAIRCVPTPYYDDFERERVRLEAQGKSHVEVVKALEMMNLGRLRVASKGLDRVAEPGQTLKKLAEVSGDEQYARGMYMIGQVAALRDRPTTVRALHEEVVNEGERRLQSARSIAVAEPPAPEPCDVAIIGMACQYPDALNVDEYWRNILKKHYAVSEVPGLHWDWRLFYDEDPTAKDKIVSKWGGFLGDMEFDPLRYGITPRSMRCIEPLQFLLLEAVRKALADSGYEHRPFARERTAAVLGIGGGGSPMAVSYGLRTCLPLVDTIDGIDVRGEDIIAKADDALPEWTEDSFPGFLMNVAVGRVANRFDLGGSNYALDAACASSLASVHACVRELELGTADVALAMGADTVQTPYAYMSFSKTHALSRKGRSRPFDAEADGIVLSEGVGVVVLKRLADAERDGDHIYAVIRGVGSSSDGREKGLTAPNAAGQIRALERAYRQARVSPAEVTLVEAHGTGTVVGDRTEVDSLSTVLRRAGAAKQSCALGSVKSMIGHSKCAAGVAGLIKTAEALHRRVLPPTLVETPNPAARFEESALYLNTEARPWVHDPAKPRTAGVSAFGFGGTNCHVVLQEYNDSVVEEPTGACDEWPSELFVWRAADAEGLTKQLAEVQNGLAAGGAPRPADLAAATWKAFSRGEGAFLAAAVADSLEDLTGKLGRLQESCKSGVARWEDPRGAWFAQGDEALPKIAFLFAGQGSQYPNMASELAQHFPLVREAIDAAHGLLAGELDRSLAAAIYPPSAFDDEAAERNIKELARTDVAQPALGAVEIGLCRLMAEFGVEPAMAAGHSYGELAALWSSGVMSDDDLIRLSYQRGKLIRAAGADGDGMIAVEADGEQVAQLLRGVENAWAANYNSPRQTVVAAAADSIEAVLQACDAAGLTARRIPVSAAFHSPLVAEAAGPLEDAIRKCSLQSPRFDVYSNATAAPYEADPRLVAEQLSEHLRRPVLFRDEVEAMQAAGAKVFLEIGPGGVLSSLTRQCLGEGAVALAVDSKTKHGVTQLQTVLAKLITHGARVDLSPLYRYRSVRPFAMRELAIQGKPAKKAKHLWLVSGNRAKPIDGPEPKLLGQRRDDEPAQTSKQPPAASVKAANRSTSAESAAAAASPTSAARATGPAPARSAAQQARPAAARPQSASATPPSRTETSSPMTTSGSRSPSPATSAMDSTQVPAGPPAAQVMLGFQNVMSRFLDTQRAVMQSYLTGSAPAEAASSPPLTLAAQTPQQRPVLQQSALHQTSAPAAPQQQAASPAAASASEPVANGSPAAATTVSAPAVSNVPAVYVEAEVVANSEHAPELSRESLENQLLELISERTGYPLEMLDIDLDLEGDLGVDSIKRVETLGKLAESLEEQGDADLESKLELEKLVGIRTVRGILDYLEDALIGETVESTSTTEPVAVEASPQPGRNGSAQHVNGAARKLEPEAAEPAPEQSGAAKAVQRGLVALTACPRGATASLGALSGVLLITDDERGVAVEVASRLADLGQNCVLLRSRPGEDARCSGDVYEADLTDEDAVKEVLALVRSDADAPIAGVLHLAPLAAFDGGAWEVRAEHDVKSVYLLARALEEELTSRDGSLFVSATALGGSLGLGDQALPALEAVGHGAILGFLKCVGLEWPQVLVRGVDVDPAESIEDLASIMLDEMADAAGPLEVGVRGAKRVTWEPVAGDFADDRSGKSHIAEGDTILVTGGARGITAVIAERIAREHQVNLVIVGRSPAPKGAEAPETAALSAPGDLKKALIERRRAAGESVAPADIEAEYRRLLSEREVRANLAKIEAAGARVAYYSADVRDEAALREVLQDAQGKFGPIAGVIHGAGVIEDKLLRDKTPESFDRVFSTKVASAASLVRLLDPQSVKFMLFFSSVASRFGNRGQSDYAAANEVLSKLAWHLDRAWPGHVAAIAWGPWSGVGMVSDLERHLAARGVTLISQEEGPRFVLDELHRGVRGESEVMIAGGADNLVKPQSSRKSEEQQAMLQGAAV